MYSAKYPIVNWIQICFLIIGINVILSYKEPIINWSTFFSWFYEINLDGQTVFHLDHSIVNQVNHKPTTKNTIQITPSVQQQTIYLPTYHYGSIPNSEITHTEISPDSEEALLGHVRGWGQVPHLTFNYSRWFNSACASLTMGWGISFVFWRDFFPRGSLSLQGVVRFWTHLTIHVYRGEPD